MSGTLPPLQQLSPDNAGPIVVVVAYTLLSVTILFTTIRVITCHTLKRGFGVDDGYIVLAAAMALVESVLTQRAVDYGLGRSRDLLDAAQIELYHKFSYAAHILAIVVMACAKSAVVQLIMRLSQRRSRFHNACHIMTGVIIFWTIFSTLSLALQCGLTHPWVYTPERCTGSGALWYPIVVLNLLTDGVLAFLFAPVLWDLKMSQKQRLTIMSLFSVRVLVCIGEIFQLGLLPSALQNPDQTASNLNLAIASQVVLNLSVITASIPSLHRFLNDLQHGAFGTRITDHQYELSVGTGSSNSGSHGLSGKLGLSSSNSKGRDDKSALQITSGSGSRFSSRIFSDHKPRKEDERPDSTQGRLRKYGAEKIKNLSSSGEGRGGRHRNGHVLHESDASLSQIGDREGGENNNNNVSNEPTPANNNNGVMKTWEISIEVEKDRKTDESVQDHEIGIATTSRDE